MKNETKHTLETWHVDKNDPRLCLAETEHLFTVYRQTVNGKDRISESVAENVSAQDARLIAAAPDLLAALQELLADKYLADPINADRMSNARTAIGKATGKGEA